MKKLLFLFLLMPWLGYAQFTVNVTTSPEFCPGDGHAQINIANTTSGALFDFQIYRLPNNSSPFRTVSGIVAPGTSFSHTETNLPSGNYSIVAYENIGGTITQRSASFSISNNFVPLEATVQVHCNNNIIVNVSKGSPQTYELRNSSNVVVAGPQTENIFNDVDPGTYTVVITDTCGNTLGKSVTIAVYTNPYGFDRNEETNYSFNLLASCNQIDHKIRLLYNNTSIPNEKFPLTITYTVKNPSGDIVDMDGNAIGGSHTYQTIWNSNADNIESVLLPYFYDQSFTIIANITDACGKSYTQEDTIDTSIFFSATKPAAACGQSFIRLSEFFAISPNFRLTLVSYPSGFVPSDYNSQFLPGNDYADFTSVPTIVDIGSVTQPVPNGTYIFEVEDECGHSYTVNVPMNNMAPVLREFRYFPGCSDEEGSIWLRITNSNNQQQSADITAIRITSAPSSFPFPLPYDVSENITSTGEFQMNSLPLGDYTFEAESSCGLNLTITRTFLPKEKDYNSTITYLCTGFNISASLTSRLGYEQMFIQKYYPATGNWGHPINGNIYVEGSILTSNNALILSNNGGAISGLDTISGTINNLTGDGEFRIILQSQVLGNGDENNVYCYETLETFTVVPGGLAVQDYYVVACADNTYNLIIEAVGVDPLNYEIVEKDGLPFALNNGSDPVFINLEAGTYKVKVSDSCGNSIHVSVRVLRNKLPVIQAENLCDGQNGRLYIEGLSFLTIEWYKNGNPTGVTGSSYYFTPYNASTDTGLYEAHLSYNPNPNACIDNILSFELTTDTENNPNAGTGQTATVYENTLSDGSINLYDYLTPPYDAHGEWTEITSSGLLYGNEWYAEFASTGTYVFEYTVNGTCSNSDSTQVTIHFFADFCTQPGDFSEAGTETKVGITLFPIQQANWPEIIPNGFLTLESKSKGFVITRVQNSSLIAEPKEGMLIYDKEASCVKLFNGENWKCIQRDCNE
jgi:hypothetical protein